MPRRKNYKIAVYSFILLLACSFLFWNPPFWRPFKISLMNTSAGPLTLLLAPFREVKRLFSYRQTYRKFQKYEGEVAALRARLIEQEELMRENSRLRGLLNLKENMVFSSVAANIISRDPSSWSSAVLIDKGSLSGIRQGLPVVSAAGVVGKTAEVGPRTSKVILIHDPNFSVAAVIQRSRESGVVSGTLQQYCRMKYLAPEADVKAGDRIITSALSSVFPEGILIGTVVSIDESQASPSRECLLKPAVISSQLEEVLVILGYSSE